MKSSVLAAVVCLCSFTLIACKPGVYFSLKPHTQQQTQKETLDLSQQQAKQAPHKSVAKN